MLFNSFKKEGAVYWIGVAALALGSLYYLLFHGRWLLSLTGMVLCGLLVGCGLPMPEKVRMSKGMAKGRSVVRGALSVVGTGTLLLASSPMAWALLPAAILLAASVLIEVVRTRMRLRRPIGPSSSTTIEFFDQKPNTLDNNALQSNSDGAKNSINDNTCTADTKMFGPSSIQTPVVFNI